METLSPVSTDLVPLADVVKDVPAAVGSAFAVYVHTLGDDELVNYEEAIVAELRRVQSLIRAQIDAVHAEIEERIVANGGKKLAVQGYDVELKDEFSAWAYDMDSLKALALLVSPEERAKILKHIPATIIPEHFEPGSAVSMNALERHYGTESPIGKALSAARTRSYLGHKLHVKKTGAP